MATRRLQFSQGVRSTLRLRHISRDLENLQLAARNWKLVSMKHAILGTGAIGGLIGTALASLGDEVIMIVRPEKLAAYPQTLSLDHPSGILKATARAVTKLTEPVDFLWIATKTYQLERALATIEMEPSRIVPLLNGIDHIKILRDRFAQDRVIAATIAVEAERISPGYVVQRTPVRLGLSATAEPALKHTVQQLEGLGFACRFVENEQTLLWGKLCFLAPFALATSASGKNNGEILSDPEWKSRLYASVAEAAAVANASGAEIDPEKLHAVFDGSPATMRSSMAKDLAAGRHLELDAISGPILRGAAQHGIGVPVTHSLVERVQGLATRHA